MSVLVWLRFSRRRLIKPRSRFKDFMPNVAVRDVGSNDVRLPTASTCVARSKLWTYVPISLVECYPVNFIVITAQLRQCIAGNGYCRPIAGDPSRESDVAGECIYFIHSGSAGASVFCDGPFAPRLRHPPRADFSREDRGHLTAPRKRRRLFNLHLTADDLATLWRGGPLPLTC